MWACGGLRGDRDSGGGGGAWAIGTWAVQVAEMWKARTRKTMANFDAMLIQLQCQLRE